jgi:hypothetical protein
VRLHGDVSFSVPPGSEPLDLGKQGVSHRSIAEIDVLSRGHDLECVDGPDFAEVRRPCFVSNA